METYILERTHIRYVSIKKKKDIGLAGANATHELLLRGGDVAFHNLSNSRGAESRAP